MASEIWKGREGGLIARKKVLYMCKESDLRRDLDNEEIADPIAGGGDGGAALAEAEGKNFGRIDPDSGLEADGECAFKDEQHGCCSFTGFVGMMFFFSPGLMNTRRKLSIPPRPTI